MRHVPSIDASGLRVLEEMVADGKTGGYIIVFSAVSRSVYRAMRKSGLVNAAGRDNFAADIFAAISLARKHLSGTASYDERPATELH